MADLKFRIKTEADLKALKETKAGLEEATKASQALGQNTDKLEQQIKEVDAALNSEAAAAVKAAEGLKKAIAATKQAGGDASGLKQQLGAVRNQYDLPGRNPLSKAAGFINDTAGKLPGAGVFQSVFNGSSATVGGVGLALAGAAKSVTEFAEAEEGAASLDAALAQSGQLTDAYREKLQALAGEFQKVTGVADDKWIDVLARLTQFGSTPETVGVDITAVKNLAGIMKGDVIGAAEAYSKALQGNYEVFSRYGIVVEEAGTQMEKLAKLQEQLAERGGGQLEARNKTLIDQWGQLKNNVSDLFEAIGRGFAKTGALQAVLYGLSESAGWLAEKLGGVIPQMEGLRNASKGMADEAGKAATATDDQADATERLAQNAKKAAEAISEQRKQSEELRRHQNKLDDLDMALELEELENSKLPEDQKIREEKRIRSNYAERRRDREMTGLVDEQNRTSLRATSVDNSRARLEQNITDQSNRLATAERKQGLIDQSKAELENAKKLGLEIADLEETAEYQKAFRDPEYHTTTEEIKRLKHREKGTMGRAEALGAEARALPDYGSVAENKQRLEGLIATGKERFPQWQQTYDDAVKDLQRFSGEIKRLAEVQSKERAIEGVQEVNAVQKAQTGLIKEGATGRGPVSAREANANILAADTNVVAAEMLAQLRKTTGDAQNLLIEEIRRAQEDASNFLQEAKRLHSSAMKEIGDLKHKVKHRD